jgi:hypothetical protein
MFLAWLYGWNFTNEDIERDAEEFEIDDEDLVNFYLFADAKCCPVLKDKAMDLLQDFLHNYELKADGTLQAYHIKTIIESTTDRGVSPIRSFCAAYLHYSFVVLLKIDVGGLSKFFKECPGLMEEYLHFQNRASGINLGSANPLKRGVSSLYGTCFFHAHKFGEKCSSKPRNE